MLGDLIRSLLDPEPKELAPQDARMALSALLVRIARSDNDYAPAEIARIDKILSRRYQLSMQEAAALRAEAEAVEAEAPDTVRFTRAIKESVPYEERKQVLGAAWAVVLADGSRAQEEDALMRMIASLLGVSDVDSAMVRKSVERL